MQNKAQCLIALACLGMVAPQADAALMAYIADDPAATGGGDTIVTDQGVGDNFPGSAVVGQINAGALGVAGFTIVTDVAQSKPLIGSAASPALSLTFSATTSDNTPHTVYLYVSDTDFTAGGTPFVLSLGGTQPPVGGNVVTGSAYGGTSNGNLDRTLTLATVGPTGVSPFALTANGTVTSALTPYSLAIGVVITRTTPGTTSGTITFAVPEPATATLAVAGFAALARRRRRPAAR